MNILRIFGLKSKTFLIILVVLVLLAGIAVYTHGAISPPNANTPSSSTASTWTVITPVWNSTLGLWYANVAGWARISANIHNTGGFAGLVFSNYAFGPYTGYVGGCIGGQSSSFFVGGECDNGTTGTAQATLTTIVQGAYVGVVATSNQNAIVSIYATNQGAVVG